MKGYSNTPLEKKIGIKPDLKIKVVNGPDFYFDFLSALPYSLNINNDTHRVFDLIHLFVKTEVDLEHFYPDTYSRLKKDGMLWISWPKHKPRDTTSLNRDIIRSYVLANGLVDVKIASINDKWSGLKFVFRRKDR